MPISRNAEIDRVCRAFERAWKTDTRPKLEDHIESADEAIRNDLLRELLATELELRQQAGESPTLLEYLDRFPNDEPFVRSTFQEAVEPVADKAAIPDRVGEFRIVREIGRGGMGVVYEAVQESLGRRVAVKTLLRRFASDEEGRQRFDREARAIARLHHSNIVDVFGNGEHDGTPFFAMRLVEGLSLDQLIKSVAAKRQTSTTAIDKLPACNTASWPDGNGQEPSTCVSAPSSKTSDSNGIERNNPQTDGCEALKFDALVDRVLTAAQLGQQLADGLQYAHDSGVLHRDVKPSNILIDGTGTPWLTDFGLARLTDHETEAGLTADGSLLGTLRYLPPEALDNMADARGDQYSLGLVLYEMIALRPAFDRSDAAGLIDDLKHSQPPRLDSLEPDTPRDLITIIHKAIDREPAARYGSVGEMAADLQRFLNDEPVLARPVSTRERFVRWRRRNPALARSLGAVALLMIIITIGSTIGTAYVFSLNTTLTGTVGDLEIRTEQLTEARNKARDDAAENLRLATAADEARQTSQTTLADMHTQRGLLALEQNDPATAMLWFANAIDLTPHDPERQAANRIRARNAMQESPRPVALFQMPPGAGRLAFQPQGNLLLAKKRGQLRIWNVQLQQALPWTLQISGVTDACWSPNGRTVVVALLSGPVQIRDVATGDVVKQVTPEEPAAVVTISRDGQWLAAGRSSVQVWDISGLATLIHTFAQRDPLRSLLFNSAGTQLAVATRKDQVFLYATGGSNSQSEPLFAPVVHKPYYGLTGPVFVDEDRHLIAITRGKQIGWVDTATGQHSPPSAGEMRLTDDKGCIAVVASPDGHRFAATTFTPDGGCVVFNGDGNHFTLNHPHMVWMAAFSPDGSMLLTGCNDLKARLWRLDAGPRAVPLVMPQLDDPRRLAFSHDNSLLAVSGLSEIRVWKRPTGNFVVGHMQDWETLWQPRPGFDGRLVTPGMWMERAIGVPPLDRLTVVDATTGQAAGPPIELSRIRDSCVCSDNRRVAIVADGEASPGHPRGVLRLHDVAAGRNDITDIPLPASPRSVAARPGHPHVAVLCWDGSLLVIDDRDGSLVHDVRTGKPESNRQSALAVPRVVYSPDGSALVTVTEGNLVAVRDADTAEYRFNPFRPGLRRCRCRSIAFTRDSRLLATSVHSPDAIQVWDLATGQAACPPISAPSGAAGNFTIGFSPDGSRIIAGNKDGYARVWDWESAKLVSTLPHDVSVRDVAFTSDGRHAVTLADGIHFWDVAGGKRIASSITDLQKPITLSIAGSRLFVSGAGNPIVNLSALMTEPAESTRNLLLSAELASGQRLVNGQTNGLTSEEWQQRWVKLQRQSAVGDVIAPVPSESPAPSLPVPVAVVGETEKPPVLSQQDEINRELAQLTRAIEGDMKYAPLLARAFYFRRIGEWGRAAADFRQAAGLQPDKSYAWSRAITAYVRADDLNRARQVCGEFTKQFAGKRRDVDLIMQCFFCLQRPDLTDKKTLPTDQFLSLPPPRTGNDFRFAMTVICRGLIQMRTGDFAMALKTLRPLERFESREVGVCALLIAAICEHRLGNASEADRLLTRATSRIPPELRTLGTAEFEGQLPVPSEQVTNFLLVAESLRREARDQ